MADSIDVIVVDDDSFVCDVSTDIIKRFYSWGNVYGFTDPEEALAFCRKMDSNFAIFVLDVFLGIGDSFGFLEAVVDKFPMAYEDTIIITGNASDDVVDMCVASNINHLLEKPIKPYALQLAIRAIFAKYLRFAKKILEDPGFAKTVASL